MYDSRLIYTINVDIGLAQSFVRLFWLKKPIGEYHYAPHAIGHHIQHNTVCEICKAVGVQGFKTNHSLHVTTATRLFQAGVDKQPIMERIGLRTIDGL